MKYEENLRLMDGDIYIRNNIKYNSFKEALDSPTSKDEEEAKMISIAIINPNAKDKLPDEIVTLKECAYRSVLSKERNLYISLDKSEIYVELFDIESSNYFIDYGFVYGNGKYFPGGTHVRSLLTGEEITLCANIGCIVGDNFDMYNTKETILSRLLPFKYCDVYLCYDDMEMNLYPSSTLESI